MTRPLLPHHQNVGPRGLPGSTQAGQGAASATAPEPVVSRQRTVDPLDILALRRALDGLTFRMERSRPIWRNKHTGKLVRVLDLLADDYGGFQGGCRRFVVVTDEPLPPGPFRPDAPKEKRYSLPQFLEHWEYTGDHAAVEPGT